MPVYEFKSDDGEVIERSFSMRRVPKFIQVKGKRYHKILSGVNVRKEFRPYSTLSLPRNMKGFNHDSKGNCIIESRQQEREVAAKTGMEWK